jgi:hypothetical protein
MCDRRPHGWENYQLQLAASYLQGYNFDFVLPTTRLSRISSESECIEGPYLEFLEGSECKIGNKNQQCMVIRIEKLDSEFIPDSIRSDLVSITSLNGDATSA